MKQLQNESGIALISMLMFLVVLTVVGLTSISVTSLENKTAQNERVYEERMNYEEGGIEPQGKILEETLFAGAIPAAYIGTGGPVVAGTNLQSEILENITQNDSVDLIGALGPDLQMTLGTTVVNMDIDYLYTKNKSGSSIEFANAYSGVGVSAGSGGTERWYQFISEATVQGASGTITNVYDCIISGGCQK